MIRSPFEYTAPGSIGEAISILEERKGRVSVLGGGTMLVPQMSSGECAPETVLDIKQLPIRGVRLDERGLVMGAGVTYALLASSELIATYAPLLKLMAEGITGGPQIHNQGTIGGSACYASPASDVPGCLVALKARMIVAATSGPREVEAADFFLGPFSTVVDVREMLVEIIIPRDQASHSPGYVKQKHCTSSWPIVTAACLADKGRLRVAIGGAASKPFAIDVVTGVDESPSDLQRRVGREAIEAMPDEWSDALAPPGYRRRIVGAVAARAVKQALELRTN